MAWVVIFDNATTDFAGDVDLFAAHVLDTGGRRVTFSVGWRVEPRLFLCLPAQSIPILVEKHFPLQNRPVYIIAERRNLTATEPTGKGHAKCSDGETGF